MKKTIVIGASMHYGVGSEVGSWVDIYRKSILKNSFGKDGVGEYSQIYNLSIPGATSSNATYFMKPFVKELNKIAPKLETQIIISIGANNTKAVDSPDNYISTPEEYVSDMATLIKDANQLAKKVTVMGFTPFDESLTNPKTNPLTGGKSYFTNSRMRLFENQLEEYCKENDVNFIPLLDTATEWGWLAHLYRDGLHAKAEAQEWLYNLLVEKDVI